MKILFRFLGLALALILSGPAYGQQSAPAAGLGIRRLVIAKRQLAFGGTSFGSAGPYEVLSGTAYGEVDPHAPGNAGIVHLSAAPVNAQGHVEYSMDFEILKPVDTKKGNGRLIYDFVDRGALYELIYPATNETIDDLGLAASRDFVSFLRYADQDSTGQPNPAREPGAGFKAALAFGISQTGRVINDFLYQGFNADTGGRTVFDGALPLLSATRRTDTNFEFAQPGRFARQHEDHQYPGDQFPFAYAATKDPVSGRTDGMLMQCEKSHTCPRIVHLDSDTEFWQSRDSLAVTDAGGRPLALPDNVRAYMMSGMPHFPAQNWNTRGNCQQIQNALSYAPYARALLVALDRWVTEGVAPPSSAFPNLKSHTLLPLAKVQASYPAIPGAPFSLLFNSLQAVDQKAMPPEASGPAYPLFFPPVDSDGNPHGGILLPDIAVPIATFSGRNVRAEGFSAGELCGLSGSYIPFAATRQERLADGDPRLSLEERYKNAQDYAEKRKHAVDALVQQGFVLPEDAETLARSMPLPGTAQGKL